MSSFGAGAAGRRLGRYHLAEPLGGGPVGEVFRAKVYGVAGFERQFAVKRLHPDLVADPEVAAALATATRMYGSLEHPRIARLHEYGVAGGATFTATALVEGIDLGRFIGGTWGAGEPLPAGAVAALVSQMARAIGYAHGRGIAHFGICPTNLICTPEGDVKITDFGVLPSRLPERPANDTSLGARMPYLAPEQLVNEPTQLSTDVFQIGAVAYELFTGQRCFKGASAFEVGQQVLSSRPKPPTLPKPLLKVLMRCLARSPFERYPDAGALADAIDAAVRSTPLPGGKRDIAQAVLKTQAHVASMHKGQVSGALSFPLPAPPPRTPAAAKRSFDQATEHTMDVATIPRRTVMGVSAPAISAIPEIPSPPPLAPSPADELPTRVREHTGPSMPSIPSVLAVPTPPTVPSVEMSSPAIELSASDFVLPGESNVSVPAPFAAIAPPSPPTPDAAPTDSAGQPGPALRLETIESLPPAEAGAELPEASPLVLPLPPQPQLLTVAAPPASRGGGRVVLGVALLAALGVGGYFAYANILADSGSATKTAEIPTSHSGTTHSGSSGDAKSDSTGLAAAKAPRIDAGHTVAVENGGPQHAGANAFDAAPPETSNVPTLPDAAVSATVTAGGQPDAASDVRTGNVPGVQAKKLTIESTPRRAKVYVDGTYKGKTPLSMEGFGDTVSLAILRPGYGLYTETIKGSGVHNVTLTAITPGDGPAGVKVRCHKKNRYYVMLDDHDTGQLCPTERIGVEKGPHSVEIYDPETEQRRMFRINVTQTRNSVRVYVD